MKFKDYYQTLGVGPDASQEEIKRAYRKLARKYHPDVSALPDAKERYVEVGEAYEALKDAKKRAAYDRLREQGYRGGQSFTPPPGWESRGTQFHWGGAGAPEAGTFSDFFEFIFGGMKQPGARKGRMRRAPRRSRGIDLHYRVRVSLEEAYRGTSRSLQVRVPGQNGRDLLAARQRTLKVNIPAGVIAGTQIRLRGEGEPGIGGGPTGDLYLDIELEPHPLFAAEGRDVVLHLPVTPWEAALGATIAVPTLGGEVQMKVPEGSQHGQKLRLKGQGLPGNPPGDQYVALNVVVPRQLSEKAKALYRELAREAAFDPRDKLNR